MRKTILIFFCLLFINNIFSQNDTIKSLVDKTENLNLEMWDLVDFAQKNIKKDRQLALFFLLLDWDKYKI